MTSLLGSKFVLQPQYVDKERLKKRLTGNVELKNFIGQITNLLNKSFQGKIENTFLPIILACVLGAQKNRLIKAVHLGSLNICVG